MEVKIAAQFLFLHLCFYLAYSLECQKCAESANSTCQKGTAETTFTCPPHEDSCYEENIVSGSVNSPYRRGCAPWNWCAMQDNTHGSALKYCRTCQGDKCNNQAFGSSPSKECLKCRGSETSTCQMGTTEDKFTCPTEEDSCYEEYIQNKRSLPLYRRGCAPWNWCATQNRNHHDALKFCRTCRGDKCNNQAFKSLNLPKCIECEGSVNSTCQMGTSQNSTSCPPDVPACYEEYIQRTGLAPIYRRECGLSNQCQTQTNVHGAALKYCRTCEGDNCNNKAIKLLIIHKCMNCTGPSYSDCQTGEEEGTEICPPGNDECFEDVIMRQGQTPLYRRGCSPLNFCGMQKKIHGKNSEYCRSCKEKKCNKRRMQTAEELEEKIADREASLNELRAAMGG